MEEPRLVPDTAGDARPQTDTACGIWDCTAPWPNLPGDIAFASLRFNPDRLLASQGAGRIPLPEQLHSARQNRRADYIAGRLCASSTVERLGGRNLHVGRRSDGAPLWPYGLCGSISHIHGQALAVASPIRTYRSLGVDVERILSPTQANALTPMILTHAERSRFDEYPPELAATTVFSLKEALFKLLHPLTGVMFFHEQAEVLSLHPDGRATLRLLETLSTQWQAGVTLPALWSSTGGLVFSITLIAG